MLKIAFKHEFSVLWIHHLFDSKLAPLNTKRAKWKILTFHKCRVLSRKGPGRKKSRARFPLLEEPPVPAGSGASEIVNKQLIMKHNLDISKLSYQVKQNSKYCIIEIQCCQLWLDISWLTRIHEWCGKHRSIMYDLTLKNFVKWVYRMIYEWNTCFHEISVKEQWKDEFITWYISKVLRFHPLWGGWSTVWKIEKFSFTEKIVKSII